MPAPTFTANLELASNTDKKDWAYKLGLLPMTDHIVFTKKSLLEFLKHKGVDVGPNFTEVNRLPNYATIGKFSSDPNSNESVATLIATEPAPASSATRNANGQFNAALGPVVDSSGADFRPTRRVREPIGGGSDGISKALFGDYDESTALSAPRAAPAPPAAAASQEPAAAATDGRAFNAAPVQVYESSGQEFRPTRRVREAIGGGSNSLASALYGDDDAEEDDSVAPVGKKFAVTQLGPADGPTWAEIQAAQDQRQRELANKAFRPSRRVREAGGTGGTSAIHLG